MSGFRTDGFRANDEQERLKFSGNLGRRFGNASEGRLYVEIEEQKLDSPGALTRAALKDNSTQAGPGAERSGAALDFTPRIHLGYRHSFLSGDDRLDVGVYWTNTDFENPTPFARLFTTTPIMA